MGRRERGTELRLAFKEGLSSEITRLILLPKVQRQKNRRIGFKTLEGDGLRSFLLVKAGKIYKSWPYCVYFTGN